MSTDSSRLVFVCMVVSKFEMKTTWRMAQRERVTTISRIQTDRTFQLNDHPSQSIVAQLLALWDGWKYGMQPRTVALGGTVASLSVLKLLCKTVFADRKCPVEPCNFVVPPDCALCEHFLAQHTDLKSRLYLTLFVSVLNSELFTFGHSLSKFVWLPCTVLYVYIPCGAV